mmetsp:Transcript_10383/g.15782  ORF Transcript_10383/g.15782 Transcript_10383/m.15782 type:complete len:678 (-) Transcript_10383:152-2185(-)
MEGEERAILEWINTFESVPECKSVSALSSGSTVGLMLAEIEPSYFESLGSIAESDNWRINSSNISKILRKLDEYFKEVLQKGIDTSSVDVNAIARGQESQSILGLIEIVIGVAVLCENKAQFIQNIFSLDQDAQVVLKDIVENVMGRMYDLETDHSPGEDGEDSAILRTELQNAEEIISNQKAEIEELRATFAEVVAANTALKQEVEALKESEFRREVDKDSDRSKAQAAANAQSHLKIELEEVKEKLNAANTDLESMKYENISLKQRLEENEQIRTRLEVEALQMADEIDLARDKSAKLAKAEATIEKYQKKMEDMTALRDQNKELEETLDKYLEKIHQLETANKSANSTTKMVEKYKDKCVVLERERFEALSSLEMKEDELNRLKADYESALDARKFLEDELANATAQLESEKSAEGERSSGLGVFESPAALKERIKQLEVELRVAKRDREQDEGVSRGGDDNEVAIDLLRAELEDTRAAKKEREDALLNTKKRLAETQHELKKATAALEEAAKSGAQSASNNDKVKELEQQLSLKVNTLKHLEGLLMESETKLNNVERDKTKLEIFAKQSLTTFKDKYMLALQRYKNDKNALEAKLQTMTEKHEKEQEKFRREERLILSAMYEIGVQTMERNINLHIHESATAPSTFLASQRADQDRRMSIGASGHSNPATPIR